MPTLPHQLGGRNSPAAPLVRKETVDLSKIGSFSGVRATVDVDAP